MMTFLVAPLMVFYISQLIQFARVSSNLAEFNARNKTLTANLLQQGYRYHKLRKVFYLSLIVDTTNWSLNTVPD